MRELVLAIRAIWATWQEGVPLRFEGEHYTHTLMTPFFDPGPLDGRPAVGLARRCRPADDRGRRRGRRRVHGPPLLHRAVAARGHAARARAGPGARRCHRRADPGVAPGDDRHRCRRGGDRGRQGRRARPDRLLRLDARVPGGARRARLGRSPAAAARPHPVGRLGGHGEPRPRRPAARRRRGGGPGRGGGRDHTPLRHRPRPRGPQRPVRRRPGASGSRSRPTSAVSRPRRRRRRGRRPPRRRRARCPPRGRPGARWSSSSATAPRRPGR